MYCTAHVTSNVTSYGCLFLRRAFVTSNWALFEGRGETTFLKRTRCISTRSHGLTTIGCFLSLVIPSCMLTAPQKKRILMVKLVVFHRLSDPTSCCPFIQNIRNRYRLLDSVRHLFEKKYLLPEPLVRSG